MSIAYNVYANTGVGDPVNYTTPVAVVTNGTSWTTSSLMAGGMYWVGVRAFDTVSGLEEKNIDCVVQISLDTNGNDISNVPIAPIGLRAFSVQGGCIKVEWFYFSGGASRHPVGFNVYVGTGPVPAYIQAATSVPYAAAVRNTFVAVLPGLSDGVSYAIGVRAYNQSGEEKNVMTVSAVAKTSGPMPVVGLVATAIV